MLLLLLLLLPLLVPLLIVFAPALFNLLGGNVVRSPELLLQPIQLVVGGLQLGREVVTKLPLVLEILAEEGGGFLVEDPLRFQVKSGRFPVELLLL